MQISYKTIATFCEHTAEMLEGVSCKCKALARRPCSAGPISRE